jgi:hypothetical protein
MVAPAKQLNRVFLLGLAYLFCMGSPAKNPELARAKIAWLGWDRSRILSLDIGSGQARPTKYTF